MTGAETPPLGTASQEGPMFASPLGDGNEHAFVEALKRQISRRKDLIASHASDEMVDPHAQQSRRLTFSRSPAGGRTYARPTVRCNARWGGAPYRVTSALRARLTTTTRGRAPSCAGFGNQDFGGDPKVSVDPPDHRQGKSAAARQDLGDSSPRPDERLEIASGPAELFAAQLDRVQRIQRLNRK